MTVTAQDELVLICGEPIPNAKYRMTLPDGSVQEGVTDAAGKTALVQSTLLDGMSFELL